MKLPSKFSVRVAEFPGLTHTVKRNDWGDYEVRWSRGFFEALMAAGKNIETFRDRVVDEDHVQAWLNSKQWQVVDFEQKKQEETLPDVFYIRTQAGEYTFTKAGDDVWCCSTVENNLTAAWHKAEILRNLKSGAWTRFDKKSLTAEQQRANKEIREQIQQLESSIKIQEQSVEHYQRMCASYRDRIEQLKLKIVEE